MPPLPPQLFVFRNKITTNELEPHVAREADSEISKKLLIQPLETKMNCFDEWGLFHELPSDMPVIFSMSSRESFHLSFVRLQLPKNNGRSWPLRQHLSLWPSRGRVWPHWTQGQGRGARLDSPWWHLISPVGDIGLPAESCSDFSHLTLSAQGLGGYIWDPRHVGWGQWVQNLRKRWAEDPGLKEEQGTSEGSPQYLWK